MPRTAILHIGCEKTGTTAIQALLARKRTELSQLGVCYPTAPGWQNHSGLASYAAPVHSVELAGAGFKPEQLVQALADEMAALPAETHTVIFSNEHCHSRVTTREEVARLHDLLAPYFSRIEVLVYLRRQDEMARSLYTTRLRFGWALDAVFPTILSPATPGLSLNDEVLAHYFDFEALLERYAAIFGRGAVHPRLYEPPGQRGGVVADFLASCNLPAALGSDTERQNRALPATAQAFLLGLNRFLAVANEASDVPTPSELRDACLYIAERHLEGPPLLPSRAEAEAFYRPFAASNERVRRDWFADRDVLFSESFSHYPETLDKSEAARALEALHDAFQIVAGMFMEIRETERAAREKLAALEGSTSWRLTAPLRAVSARWPAIRRRKPQH